MYVCMYVCLQEIAYCILGMFTLLMCICKCMYVYWSLPEGFQR